MYCARHPHVETGLTCNRCGTPICPDCSVAGAVGMLCPACAKSGRSPLYQVRPERIILALIAGVGSGIVAGFLLQHLGFFLLIVAPILGGFLGEIIRRAVGHKAGPVVEALTGASLVAGALLSTYFTGMWIVYLHSPLSLVFFVIALALAVGAAIARVRY